MRFSFASRVVAALIAVAAGLAGPSTALAHGLEHTPTAHAPVWEEHASMDPAHGHHHARDADGATTVTSPRSDDHPHPRMEAGPTGRATSWSPAAMPVTTAVLFDTLPSVAAPVVLPEEVPRSGTTDPPPKLRAPPVR